MAEAKKKEKTAEEIRKQQATEKIPYIARRPVGVSHKVEDVTVTINGYNYRVKYDEQVMIPRFVAEVLDNAYKEGKNTADLINKKIYNKEPIAEM